ncbi:MAG: hypothetical protein J5621_09340 [Paludibacteraceae bacterium]|nr:hypothetical protein [Paludibacteraceae bacterium]
MTYTSFSDLANTIRKNLWKVPSDIGLIVGVPRSGLLAALVLGEMLNKPVIDLDGFIEGKQPQIGSRGRLIAQGVASRVLVLDDTVYSGGSMERVRAKLQHVQSVPILYGCIYAEGRDAKEKVDLFFEDNYNPNEELWHLYEWNILHHGNKLSKRCMFDLDGVLCLDPPDERDVEHYENYIANARPMVLPTTKIGAIVTFRLAKYRKETESWLRQNGIEYGDLIMFNGAEHLDKSAEAAARYKAKYYSIADWATLFVESSAKQAEMIHKFSGKQVFCYENGVMYG